MAPQNHHDDLDRKLDVLYNVWVDSKYSGKAETALRSHISNIHARKGNPLWLSAKLAIHRFHIYLYRSELDAARRAVHRALTAEKEPLTAARKTWLEKQMEDLDEQHDSKYKSSQRLDEKFSARGMSKWEKRPRPEPARPSAAHGKVTPEAANDKVALKDANVEVTPKAVSDKVTPDAANDTEGLAKSIEKIEAKSVENQNGRRDSVQANQTTTTKFQDDGRARVQAWVNASATSRGHTSSLLYGSPSQLDEAGPSRRVRSIGAAPCDKYGRQIMDGGKRKRPSKKEQQEAEQRELEDRLYELKSKKRKINNSDVRGPKRRTTAAKRLTEEKAAEDKMKEKEGSIIQKHSQQKPDKQGPTKAKVDAEKNVRVPAISMTAHGEKSASPKPSQRDTDDEKATPKVAPTKQPIVKKPIVKHVSPNVLFMTAMAESSTTQRLVRTTKITKADPGSRVLTAKKATADIQVGEKERKGPGKKEQSTEEEGKPVEKTSAAKEEKRAKQKYEGVEKMPEQEGMAPQDQETLEGQQEASGAESIGPNRSVA